MIRRMREPRKLRAVSNKLIYCRSAAPWVTLYRDHFVARPAAIGTTGRRSLLFNANRWSAIRASLWHYFCDMVLHPRAASAQSDEPWIPTYDHLINTTMSARAPPARRLHNPCRRRRGGATPAPVITWSLAILTLPTLDFDMIECYLQDTGRRSTAAAVAGARRHRS
ncbi:hypothetical protein EVAR_46314_1 [Eumeta japonica]|uniref:Uncharacterized protein n=1 Tax=Eumeta variegata TaxID=151549 RepID=A0A4C1XW26_EUMVA|nr:hypothetical protein EVAR_46314_1 [Eumeta japonica]